MTAIRQYRGHAAATIGFALDRAFWADTGRVFQLNGNGTRLEYGPLDLEEYSGPPRLTEGM